jgi:hypothetical protein
MTYLEDRTRNLLAKFARDDTPGNFYMMTDGGGALNYAEEMARLLRRWLRSDHGETARDQESRNTHAPAHRPHFPPPADPAEDLPAENTENTNGAGEDSESEDTPGEAEDTEKRGDREPGRRAGAAGEVRAAAPVHEHAPPPAGSAEAETLPVRQIRQALEWVRQRYG